MRLFGLIGHPLTHSYSQKYFTEKFNREGIADCRYELFPLENIDELIPLINSLPELAGLNVTIPYKQQVIPFLQNTEGIPAGLSSCNCIRVEKGYLSGFNTDLIGFEQSIRPLLKLHHQKALILGNGGAAQAVAFVLRKMGIEFHLVGRTIHDGATLTYKQLSKEIIEENKLIINTTPLGMSPDSRSFPGIPYAYIGPEHLLYDLIYNPATTVFLQKGKEQGALIKNGLEMLTIQAEESWKIWTSVGSG
jgi:shikimate dehydrogenase